MESVAVVVDANEAKEVEAGRSLGAATAEGARFTRNLQMQPGNVCTPAYLAEQAAGIAKTYGFGITVLDLAAIKKEGMGALLAVSQGSAQEPRFIVLEYKGAGDTAPLAIVGKGVTFDSGGICRRLSSAVCFGSQNFDRGCAAFFRRSAGVSTGGPTANSPPLATGGN